MTERAFPPAEYAARVERARTLMPAHGLAALLVGTGPNLTYLTGYPSPPKSPSRPFLFLLPRDGEPCLIVQDGRLGEARRTSWVMDIRTYAPLSHLPVALLEDVLRERGLATGVIGLERGYEMEPNFPAWELDALAAWRSGLVWGDGSHLLWALRLVKSPREVDLIRQACRITTAAYARCLPQLRVGMSEREAAVLFQVAHLEAGGADPRVTATSGAGNYGLASQAPGPRRFEPGDLVWFDLGCAVGGYHSDFSRAAVLGPVSDQRRRAQDVVNRATRAGIERVRPGAPVADVARACYQVLEAAGLPVTAAISRLGGRAGHGLGLTALEPPSVNEEDPTVLRAGMVVTVEPAVATADGIFHHEHDVLVTEDGPEVISEAPVELFEVR